jgi:hypothetical protein
VNRLSSTPAAATHASATPTSGSSTSGHHHSHPNKPQPLSKHVSNWLGKSQLKITKCHAVFQTIVKLAMSDLLISSTTHYGIIQEWSKIGFFDLDPETCAFHPLIKPDFIPFDDNFLAGLDYEEYKDITLHEIDNCDKFWKELNDFHCLFIQIYIALEISILYQRNFRILFNMLMNTTLGHSVNERANFIYEYLPEGNFEDDFDYATY